MIFFILMGPTFHRLPRVTVTAVSLHGLFKICSIRLTVCVFLIEQLVSLGSQCMCVLHFSMAIESGLTKRHIDQIVETTMEESAPCWILVPGARELAEINGILTSCLTYHDSLFCCESFYENSSLSFWCLIYEKLWMELDIIWLHVLLSNPYHPLPPPITGMPNTSDKMDTMALWSILVVCRRGWEMDWT